MTTTWTSAATSTLMTSETQRTRFLWRKIRSARFRVVPLVSYTRTLIHCLICVPCIVIACYATRIRYANPTDSITVHSIVWLQKQNRSFTWQRLRWPCAKPGLWPASGYLFIHNTSYHMQAVREISYRHRRDGSPKDSPFDWVDGGQIHLD